MKLIVEWDAVFVVMVYQEQNYAIGQLHIWNSTLSNITPPPLKALTTIYKIPANSKTNMEIDFSN